MKKTVAEMMAESFREVGVLVLVFGLLDQAVSHDAMPPGWTLSVIMVSFVAFIFGIVIERRR